jgi:hypothetical protein
MLSREGENTNLIVLDIIQLEVSTPTITPSMQLKKKLFIKLINMVAGDHRRYFFKKRKISREPSLQYHNLILHVISKKISVLLLRTGYGVKLFNATFNVILVISWQLLPLNLGGEN